MNILEIIAKKRDKKELTKEEIEYFIENYTNGNIPDYQASALVMAIYINGMTIEETVNLTLAMAKSGDILNLSEFGNVVDKHSTGGVGDKITLILMPIMSAMGVKVAKMSGRGLGFTGGTADKLESIPGYRVNLTDEEFRKNVKEIGISLITQTANLAPADKKLYALRDVISCTDNIPLIASSIMSKKIAAGANKIVLDVTCGSGAFMQDEKKAIELSKVMKQIGQLAQKEVICVITRMQEPLGYYVGNTLEIIETIKCLKGDMPEDIKEVVLTLGSYILKLAKLGDNLEENKIKIEECISSKKAYNKFLQLIERQGGNISYIENYKNIEMAKYKLDIMAENDGYIEEINAREVGEVAGMLGAGRTRKEDEIDNLAGVVLYKKVGDFVQKNEKIATLYTSDNKKIELSTEKMKEAIKISDNKVEKESMILEII